MFKIKIESGTKKPSRDPSHVIHNNTAVTRPPPIERALKIDVLTMYILVVLYQQHNIQNLGKVMVTTCNNANAVSNFFPK